MTTGQAFMYAQIVTLVSICLLFVLWEYLQDRRRDDDR